jgi:hypothetical protein
VLEVAFDCFAEDHYGALGVAELQGDDACQMIGVGVRRMPGCAMSSTKQSGNVRFQ